MPAFTRQAQSKLREQNESLDRALLLRPAALSANEPTVLTVSHDEAARRHGRALAPARRAFVTWRPGVGDRLPPRRRAA